MDVMNVFVIIGRGWTKEKIVKEISEEGYNHNFYFSDGEPERVSEKEMFKSNEVWCFGDCTGYNTHRFAVNSGFDIWRMG